MGNVNQSKYKGKQPVTKRKQDSSDSEEEVVKAKTKKHKGKGDEGYSLRDSMRDLMELSQKSDNLIAAKFDRANDAILALGRMFLTVF